MTDKGVDVDCPRCNAPIHLDDVVSKAELKRMMIIAVKGADDSYWNPAVFPENIVDFMMSEEGYD